MTSEYQAHVAAALRQGHSMQEAAASWPGSPEREHRQLRHDRITELLRSRRSFGEARRIADEEHAAAHRSNPSLLSGLRRRFSGEPRQNPSPSLLMLLVLGGAGYWYLTTHQQAQDASATSGVVPGAGVAPALTIGGSSVNATSYISYQQWWTKWLNGGVPPASGTSFPNIVVPDVPPSLIQPYLGGTVPMTQSLI